MSLSDIQTLIKHHFKNFIIYELLMYFLKFYEHAVSLLNCLKVHFKKRTRSRCLKLAPSTVSQLLTGARKFRQLHWKERLKISKDANAPSTSIAIFLNPQLFLSGYDSRPHVSGESGVRIRNFFNPLSRMEIFKHALNPESCGR